VNGAMQILESLILFAAVIGMFAWTIRLCVIDAQRRGKSPLLVTLLILISFPLGLILWLIFRPEPPSGTANGFRLEDHRVQ
jgi:hypothetical protein